MVDNKKEQKSKNPMKLVIIIVIAVAVLGGGTFAGYMLFFAKKDAPKEAGTNSHTTATTQATVAQTPNGQVVITGNNQFVVISKYNYDLGEFLVNLGDEGGKRYLKAKVSIGYDNKKMPKELEEKKVMMRDAVISVLRAKKAADFTEKGTEDLKMEILKRINPLLTTGQCNNVYFQDILVQ